MRAPTLEHPNQIRLKVQVVLLRRPNHAEEHRPTVRTLDAPRKQGRKPTFRIPLKLSLRLIVIERDVRIVDEPSQCRRQYRAVLKIGSLGGSPSVMTFSNQPRYLARIGTQACR